MELFSQNHMSYDVLPLSAKSSEYQRIYDIIQGEYLIQINQIFIIDNPYLYKMFNKTYDRSKSLNKKTQILELFHSTHIDNVQSIIENNFDWRLVRRARYGHGVSFSRYPEHTNLHSSFGSKIYNDEGIAVIKAMFVVDVIVGHKVIGDNSVILPEWPCDTTVSKDQSVYVKYFDHEFYPKYVIYYISYPVGYVHGRRVLHKY